MTILPSSIGEYFPFAADFQLNFRYLARKDPTQFGEYFLLKQHLPQVVTYLEIGCFQPIALSNSYALKKLGISAQGVSVDAAPGLEVQWRIFRPRSNFLQAAVVGEDYPNSIIELEVFKRRYGGVNRISLESLAPDIASLVEADRPHLSDEVHGIPIKIEVEAIRLIDLVAKSSLKELNLIMIDVEGADSWIARDLRKLNQLPTFLLIEMHSQRMSDLENLGYKSLGRCGPSVLFKLS